MILFVTCPLSTCLAEVVAHLGVAFLLGFSTVGEWFFGHEIVRMGYVD